MNKKLWSVEVGRTIKRVNTKEDEGVEFEFEDGEMLKIKTHHDQDCCENVYGEFNAFTDNKCLVGKHVDSIIFKGVKDMGFLVCLADEKILVPCHNEQNGYYSNQLEIVITQGSAICTIDLEGFIEDGYC